MTNLYVKTCLTQHDLELLSVFMIHSMQGSILACFQTRQPGKDVRKGTCPDKI